MDDRERAVGIVLKLLHSTAAAKASASRQLASMVEEVAVSLKVFHATVVGKRLGVFEWHYRSNIFPRTFGFVADRISDVLRHSTSRIQQPVFSVALGNPRSFGIAVLVFLALHAFSHRRCAKAFLCHFQFLNLAVDRHHVVVQTCEVNLRIAPIDVCLSVVIYHHCRVDIIPRAIVEERFSQGILERTSRRVGHCDAYCHAVCDFRMGADVPIIFSVALNGLCRPSAVVSP